MGHGGGDPNLSRQCPWGGTSSNGGYLNGCLGGWIVITLTLAAGLFPKTGKTDISNSVQVAFTSVYCRTARKRVVQRTYHTKIKDSRSSFQSQCTHKDWGTLQVKGVKESWAPCLLPWVNFKGPSNALEGSFFLNLSYTPSYQLAGLGPRRPRSGFTKTGGN